jgi:hypothetical protein
MAAPQIFIPVSGSRLFPPISNDFGSAEWIEAQKISYPVLKRLSLDTGPLPRWKEWAGLNLRPEQAITRFLRLVNAAIVSETKAEFRRADFLWRLVHRICSKLNNIQGWGADKVNEPNVSPAKEVVLNAHLAAFEAWQQSGAQQGKGRLQAHLRYLCRLVSLVTVSKEEEEGLLGQRLFNALTRAIEAKNWQQMEEIGQELMERFPQRFIYLKALADGYSERCVAEFWKGNDESIARKNAKTLNETIVQIERIRRLAPHCRHFYDLLGDLSSSRAVQFANAGLLSDAVVCSERARCYNPLSDDIRQLCQALSKALQTLQEQMKRAVANLGYRQQLNAKGQQLLAQAQAGFTPANRFNESDEAKEIERNGTIARAYWLWRWIGLGSHMPNPELLLRVREAVGDVFSRAAESPAHIKDLWLQQISEHSELGGVNASVVVAFLRARVEGKDIDEPEEDPIPTPLDPIGSLQIGVAGQRQKLEPFGLWVFSGESRFLKIASSFLICLMVIFAGLTVRDANHRSARLKSYEAMRTAMLNQDYETAMQQAVYFLGTPVFAEDAREPEVRRSYAEALVRWAANQSVPPSSDNIHLRDYRRLVRE